MPSPCTRLCVRCYRAVLQSAEASGGADGVRAGVRRHSGHFAPQTACATFSDAGSSSRVEEQLAQLLTVTNMLWAHAKKSKERQDQQQQELRALAEAQQYEMRHVVETLVTQVNDISRTLTEASRSQSRWM